MTRVAVTNASSVVSNPELDTMVSIAELHMREFCHRWELAHWPVTVGGEAFCDVVVVDHDTDVPDALAYHSVDEGHPIGVVMAGTIKEAGGDLLGPGGILSALTHELDEMRADPYANFSAGSYDGWVYWLEPDDAVQALTYEMHGGHVSNYCLRRWFNPAALGGPYDRMGECSRPFELLDGGYQVRNQPGKEATVWGKLVAGHGWRAMARIKHAAALAYAASTIDRARYTEVMEFFRPAGR